MAFSSRFAMPFLCILAILSCLAGLGAATNLPEAHDRPFPAALRSYPASAESKEEKHEFGDLKSYDHVLRLPSERHDSISIEERPNGVYPKWVPRFPAQGRPFMMPFHRELGKSRYLDQRDLIVGRLPFRGRWPFRFGRPGGCDHSKLKHFLMRRGGYGHRYFPGSKGPDSITLHLEFDGEVGTFHMFPIQPEYAKFRPGHRFGPADLEEPKPYDPAIDVPKEQVQWVSPREAAPRSHEDHEEGPVGRWMGWLKSLFHLP